MAEVSKSTPARSFLHGSLQVHAQLLGVSTSKQCVANIIAAVIFNEIKNILTWSEDNINDVDAVYRGIS